MHFLTEHAQNSVSTAVRQISPPGSISVVRTRLADLELQNVLDGKGAILGHRNDTDGLPTPSILSVSFWDVVTCLLKKKKKTAYACKTYHLQWSHKHLCTMDIEQKPETLPSGVRIRSRTFPLGLCAGPSRPSLTGSPGTTQRWGADLLFTQTLGPSPCWGSPGSLGSSPGPSCSSGFLPVLQGLRQ